MRFIFWLLCTSVAQAHVVELADDDMISNDVPQRISVARPSPKQLSQNWAPHINFTTQQINVSAWLIVDSGTEAASHDKLYYTLANFNYLAQRLLPHHHTVNFQVTKSSRANLSNMAYMEGSCEQYEALAPADINLILFAAGGRHARNNRGVVGSSWSKCIHYHPEQDLTGHVLLHEFLHNVYDMPHHSHVFFGSCALSDGRPLHAEVMYPVLVVNGNVLPALNSVWCGTRRVFRHYARPQPSFSAEPSELFTRQEKEALSRPNNLTHYKRIARELNEAGELAITTPCYNGEAMYGGRVCMFGERVATLARQPYRPRSTEWRTVSPPHSTLVIREREFAHPPHVHGSTYKTVASTFVYGANKPLLRFVNDCPGKNSTVLEWGECFYRCFSRTDKVSYQTLYNTGDVCRTRSGFCYEGSCIVMNRLDLPERRHNLRFYAYADRRAALVEFARQHLLGPYSTNASSPVKNLRLTAKAPAGCTTAWLAPLAETLLKTTHDNFVLEHLLPSRTPDTGSWCYFNFPYTSSHLLIHHLLAGGDIDSAVSLSLETHPGIVRRVPVPGTLSACHAPKCEGRACTSFSMFGCQYDDPTSSKIPIELNPFECALYVPRFQPVSITGAALNVRVKRKTA